jgi:hypothetical protein
MIDKLTPAKIDLVRICDDNVPPSGSMFDPIFSMFDVLLVEISNLLSRRYRWDVVTESINMRRSKVIGGPDTS